MRLDTCRLRQLCLRSVTVACAGAIVAAVVATGVAQGIDPPNLVTRKVRFRGGADPNVKPGAEVNVRDNTSPVTPPNPSKPAPTRPMCAITFDNVTNLITRTYIDGRYAGTITPLSRLSATTAPGSAVLYARAEYEDGSADAWGPVRVSCRTQYLWRLAD